MRSSRRYRTASARRWALALCAISAAPTSAQVWEVDNQLLIDGDDGNSLARFGSSLAAGDFDGDGDTDLAVGAPNQNSTAGFVHLFLSGGEPGLTQAAVPTMAGAFAFEQYGAVLAAGDFNNDGKDDLVIGAPGWDATGPIDQAGRVVVWGYAGGFWSTLVSLSQSGTPTSPEAMDHFGKTLAVGYFNDDAYADLAVGAPDEDVTTEYSNAGAVVIFFGSASGLTTSGSQGWFRDTGGITDTPADNQALGRALAAGDFDGDGRDDLAIGSYDTFTGHVVVLNGGSTGLVSAGQYVIGGDDIPQDPGGTGFGEALVAIELQPSCSSSCADDLVIGMTNATVVLPNTVSVFNAGAAFVINGSSALGGLDPDNAVAIDALDVATPLNEGVGNGDHFGKSLAAGGLRKFPNESEDDPGSADLVFGIPDLTLSGTSLAGGASLLLGGESPLASGFSQGLASLPGLESAPAGFQARFATALAIGDFNDDGVGDLAVGIPYRTVGANDDAGAVQILYGALFADGFESSGLTNWSNF